MRKLKIEMKETDNVWQKLLQYCKIIILQLKKLKKRKNDHKNISRTFSGFVVSIVGSVHYNNDLVSKLWSCLSCLKRKIPA